MFTTLDRYIIRKFFSTFFFTVLIFTLISVIIDFSEKVEKFIEEPITRSEIFVEYYPSFILYMTGLLWPLFTLIAVIFFTSRLAFNSEIIAILNAGVSFNRFLRPYLFSAGVLTVLYLFGTHVLIPAGNKHMFRILYTYISKNEDKARVRDIHLFVAPGKKVYIGYYSKSDSSVRDFRIEHFEGQRLTGLLKADRAQWQQKTQKWRLYDYESRTFPDTIRERLFVGIGRQLDTVLNLSPADFVDYTSQQSMMSTRQLVRHIHLLGARGAGNIRKYDLELQRRTAEPITIFILTIIGVAIAARKVRGGVGLHLAMGIGLGALYVFLSKFASTFAQDSDVPAWLGAWLPNFLFFTIALRLVSKAQK